MRASGRYEDGEDADVAVGAADADGPAGGDVSCTLPEGLALRGPDPKRTHTVRSGLPTKYWSVGPESRTVRGCMEYALVLALVSQTSRTRRMAQYFRGSAKASF